MSGPSGAFTGARAPSAFDAFSDVSAPFEEAQFLLAGFVQTLVPLLRGDPVGGRHFPGTFWLFRRGLRKRRRQSEHEKTEAGDDTEKLGGQGKLLFWRESRKPTLFRRHIHPNRMARPGIDRRRDRAGALPDLPSP